MPSIADLATRVILSDTFDQWRMKTNEWLSMTNSAGSSNFIKTNATTNSTSNTTGAITTAGGLGIGSSAVVGGNLTVFGDADVDGTLNIDVLDIDGAVQIDGAVTIGVDGTSVDVTLFGDTASSKILWDESDNALEFGNSFITMTCPNNKPVRINNGRNRFIIAILHLTNLNIKK